LRFGEGLAEDREAEAAEASDIAAGNELSVAV
jgi:hypothetical protein